MRRNVENIVKAFISGRRGGNVTLSTDGDTVFSYDMPIAQRLRNGSLEVITRDQGPSATTRTHIAGVGFALEQAGHMPREVAVLTGHAPHVFRDRAGQEGYISRHRQPPQVVAPTRRKLRAV